MELKNFIAFLENNVTEEAFEAMALHFAKRRYNIIGCNFNLRDNVKIYKLCHWYTSDECYMVVNYYNEFLDAELYPKDSYMIVENNIDTLMYLCNELYCSDRIKSRVPYCLKEICNCIFEFTRYPLQYFDYECENKFYDIISKKHEKQEEMYLENLRVLFQKCTRELLEELKNCGLLLNDKDWNKRTNTLTLTNKNGVKNQYLLRFEIDGSVEFTDKNTMLGFDSYIVEEADIQKFKERVLRFVN